MERVFLQKNAEQEFEKFCNRVSATRARQFCGDLDGSVEKSKTIVARVPFDDQPSRMSTQVNKCAKLLCLRRRYRRSASYVYLF